MEQSIQGYLGSLRLGEVQQFKNLAMVPVVSDYDDCLVYITLGEALGAGSIEIREVSEGGSVPELRVVNRAGKMVLILDGEELVGAKQNRIVNTPPCGNGYNRSRNRMRRIIVGYHSQSTLCRFGRFSIEILTASS